MCEKNKVSACGGSFAPRVAAPQRCGFAYAGGAEASPLPLPAVRRLPTHPQHVGALRGYLGVCQTRTRARAIAYAHAHLKTPR
jgi:hypothetical protein